MMVLSALRPDADLPEFLAHRARSSSVVRLTVDLAAGIAMIGEALWWHHFAWLVIASVGWCFVSYGAWGLLDRARGRSEIAARRVLTSAIDALSALFAACGIVAASAVLLSVWALALGTWIS